MKRTLLKNLISFMLICVLIASLSAALFAATDAYNDGTIAATLSADKFIFGDTASATTSDMIDTHWCCADGNMSDLNVRTFLSVEIRCYGNYEPPMVGDYDEQINTNSISFTFGPGFGKDMTDAISIHELELYCEEEFMDDIYHDTSLFAIAD